MCKFKSMIVLKNKVVLAPDGNESHSDLLESLGIEDTTENAMRKFVRVELVPPDGNKAKDVSEWKFNIDQDITPDWYNEDPKRYEDDCREAVRDYLKDKFTVICGYAWNEVSFEGKRLFLLNGNYKIMRFGSNNNYATSDVRNELINSDLARELKEKFGDKLVPITTDLLSLDGLDDYGIVEGDILAIPTIDLYRKIRKQIPKNDRWWLATPDSTPFGCSSDDVQIVRSDGGVYCDWYGYGGSVRPFFILES